MHSSGSKSVFDMMMSLLDGAQDPSLTIDDLLKAWEDADAQSRLANPPPPPPASEKPESNGDDSDESDSEPVCPCVNKSRCLCDLDEVLELFDNDDDAGDDHRKPGKKNKKKVTKSPRSTTRGSPLNEEEKADSEDEEMEKGKTEAEKKKTAQEKSFQEKISSLSLASSLASATLQDTNNYRKIVESQWHVVSKSGKSRECIPQLKGETPSAVMDLQPQAPKETKTNLKPSQTQPQVKDPDNFPNLQSKTKPSPLIVDNLPHIMDPTPRPAGNPAQSSVTGRAPKSQREGENLAHGTVENNCIEVAADQKNAQAGNHVTHLADSTRLEEEAQKATDTLVALDSNEISMASSCTRVNSNVSDPPTVGSEQDMTGTADGERDEKKQRTSHPTKKLVVGQKLTPPTTPAPNRATIEPENDDKDAQMKLDITTPPKSPVVVYSPMKPSRPQKIPGPAQHKNSIPEFPKFEPSSYFPSHPNGLGVLHATQSPKNSMPSFDPSSKPQNQGLQSTRCVYDCHDHYTVYYEKQSCYTCPFELRNYEEHTVFYKPNAPAKPWPQYQRPFITDTQSVQEWCPGTGQAPNSRIKLHDIQPVYSSHQHNQPSLSVSQPYPLFYPSTPYFQPQLHRVPPPAQKFWPKPQTYQGKARRSRIPKPQTPRRSPSYSNSGKVVEDFQTIHHSLSDWLSQSEAEFCGWGIRDQRAELQKAVDLLTRVSEKLRTMDRTQAILVLWALWQDTIAKVGSEAKHLRQILQDPQIFPIIEKFKAIKTSLGKWNVKVEEWIEILDK